MFTNTCPLAHYPRQGLAYQKNTENENYYNNRKKISPLYNYQMSWDGLCNSRPVAWCLFLYSLLEFTPFLIRFWTWEKLLIMPNFNHIYMYIEVHNYYHYSRYLLITNPTLDILQNHLEQITELWNHPLKRCSLLLSRYSTTLWAAQACHQECWLSTKPVLDSRFPE